MVTPESILTLSRRAVVAPAGHGKTELIAKVVEWDRKTPHAYDPRWINLHGIQAVQAAKDPQLAAKLTQESLSLPQSQWAALAEQTRTKYLQGFKDAITQLKVESK